MTIHMKRCSIFTSLLLLLGAAASAAGPFTFKETPETSECEILYCGQPLMNYAFHPQKYKPYVKALCTLKGQNVLRDAPHDHLHHHALMYGIRVNGLNFWEEISGSGVQRVIGRPIVAANPEGSSATISHTLYWVYPADAFLPVSNTPALLIERRTLTLSVDEKVREVALHWRSEFQVGTKTNSVVLTGSSYHGLGMRFARELDPTAVHLTATGKPDLSDNKQDVSQHPWEAVKFGSGDKAITVALFGHPKNARGDAQFFSMRTPFAYLSATQNLDKEPLVYQRGDRFELNYVVTLYDSEKTAEEIAARRKKLTPLP